MFCEKCGTQMANNEAFCPTCGAAAVGTNASPGQAYAPAQSYATQQYAPVNNMYTPPYAGSGTQAENLTVGQYIGMMIVSGIPLVGFIMLLVWAFGDGNINKKNYAKAALLLGIIVGVLSVIIWIIVAATLGSALSYYNMN